MAQLENIEAIETRLWRAADLLRSGSEFASNEYFMPVMGLIFLRHAYSRFLAVKPQIEQSLPSRHGVTRALTKEDFSQKGSIFLRPEAQFDYFITKASDTKLPDIIVKAMETIEEDYSGLKGVLPKQEYQSIPYDLLGDLVRTLNPEELKTASGDVFGRIYEYFLTKFADLKAHDGGEFFTPISLVQFIANVLEPTSGTVLDPACGSGGMFVQSARIVEQRHQNPSQRLTFRGYEKNKTTVNLAKMNLAVHGLEGDIQQNITYYDDPVNLLHKCDYVLANPPFNVDEVDAGKIANDPRLPFGLPGVTLAKGKKNGDDKGKGRVQNGNYLWIQYFYSYLNAKGRAGFVMSSQASSAGRDEAKVRQSLIKTGHVDIMVAIRSNFFYTRTVPCELWFLNKAKPAEHRDKVLMLDARGVYRKVTRKIFDFSPEQLQNLLSIVWLYHGQPERFRALVASYLNRTWTEAAEVPALVAAFDRASAALEKLTRPFLQTMAHDAAHASPLDEFLAANRQFQADAKALLTGLKALPTADESDQAGKLRKRTEDAAPTAEKTRELGKQADHLFKLAERLLEVCEKSLDSKASNEWKNKDVTLAQNMRDALPRASFLGFTGTPLIQGEDEQTKRIFGGYVSTYDFQRAVEDGATVPLFYDARGEKLGIATTALNEKIATVVEQAEINDQDVAQRLEAELKRDYHIITAKKRLEQVAEDFVRQFSEGWESGKAMLVCIDKITCVRMYELILPLWEKRIHELEAALKEIDDDQEVQFRTRQIAWMRETLMAVVISEEQGEVERFKKWKLDIKPHRKLIKEGFELPDGKRLAVETAFKRESHPFRVAIVCAMWMTGFDVPSLSTLYLDKPLKAHTLMQAIARANRVNEGKENGLIVDYCGILKNLRKALATFAGRGDEGHGGGDGSVDPTRPKEELLEALAQGIDMVRAFLTEHGASLDDIKNLTGFARNAAIVKAKEAANESDESRKRFEILCRAVFSMYKSCFGEERQRDFRNDRDAINIVYKSLQDDKQHADISEIIQSLHSVIDEAIATRTASSEPSKVYDISKIDFERLRQEFHRTKAPNTTVQNLRVVIEKRLQRLIAQNPLRTDFQEHYEQIVREYNLEKDRAIIERTFEELLRFIGELDEEQSRAIREGLDPESLVLYDLLMKPALAPNEIAQIKKVAMELLSTLKEEKLKVDQWRDKEGTRDAVHSAIFDFLYSDKTGLPSAYSEDEIKDRSDRIFQHVFYAYPMIPSPIFAVGATAE